MSMFSQSEVRELSSGLIIAGAYADKIRRTLFAQLKDTVKQDKEFAKEVARASAELNTVLFNILVNELRIDKGDVIRVRVNYSLDPRTKKITWDYNSLRVEAFKRIPDEHVVKVVYDVVRNKLTQILESFRLAPRAAEEAVRAFGVPEEKVEEVIAPPPVPTPAPPPLPTPAVPPQFARLLDLVGSVDVIGETIERGILVKLSSRDGQSLGIATISPSGDEVVIDAIVVYSGVSMRYITRTRGKVESFVNTPEKVVEELSKVTPTELTKNEAETLIREKMQSLL